MPESYDDSLWELIKNLKKGRNLPVIALLSPKMVASLDNRREIDDFIVHPYNDAELFLRINRLLKKTPDAENTELIKCNGLTIDVVTCEVTVDDKKADLTFKEYELLKLMARNRGRVFTRETLLDKIWGYDYYGGDRTVDVHMRRLRSKIEDASHTYIETVRNIGYRFVKNAQS
jgi:DNA-binding response OmpR family regulator